MILAKMRGPTGLAHRIAALVFAWRISNALTGQLPWVMSGFFTESAMFLTTGQRWLRVAVRVRAPRTLVI
jgi:hypothetical protein